MDSAFPLLNFRILGMAGIVERDYVKGTDLLQAVRLKGKRLKKLALTPSIAWRCKQLGRVNLPFKYLFKFLSSKAGIEQIRECK